MRLSFPLHCFHIFSVCLWNKIHSKNTIIYLQLNRLEKSNIFFCLYAINVCNFRMWKLRVCIFSFSYLTYNITGRVCSRFREIWLHLCITWCTMLTLFSTANSAARLIPLFSTARHNWVFASSSDAGQIQLPRTQWLHTYIHIYIWLSM